MSEKTVNTHAELVKELSRADKANEALVYYDRTDRPWISWLDSKRQRWAVSYPVKGDHFVYSDPFTLAAKIDAWSDFIRLPIRIVDAHVKATGNRPSTTGSEQQCGRGPCYLGNGHEGECEPGPSIRPAGSEQP